MGAVFLIKRIPQPAEIPRSRCVNFLAVKLRRPLEISNKRNRRFFNNNFLISQGGEFTD